MKIRFLPLIVAVLCAESALNAASVDFVRDVRPVLEKHCYSCHGPEKQKGGLRLDVKSAAMKGGEEHAPNIIPGKAKESPLLIAVRGEDEDLKMPPKGERLSAAEVEILTRWVMEGAEWPEGVDSVKLVDAKAHWSFQPMTNPEVPEPAQRGWARDPMDRFILKRLEQEGLQPSPEASRAAWIRRVSFDLTGLPPTPEQVMGFETDSKPDAYERVVDAMLSSPRFGEQWAQHWLDLVRYADTHGFEVNTERPNAWPYRDYVIRAMNADVPYNEFVRQQLAGDRLGQDAATGFLVTASVLLPGQIGADDASKRLARQDSLDEIVVNTSQTFLGLSVGCARCHNHKFDPISAKDYYAMQAFFAGVEYRDRPLQTPEAEAARQRAKEVREQIARLEKQLGDLAPLARSGVARAEVNAKVNVDRFAPVKTRKVKLTIEATNSLEPCIDELEVFNVDGVNVALALSGAMVNACGQTLVADRHDLRFLNDGKYGNSRSWMSNEKGKGWVVLEFPQEHVVERVVWGRDREGKFTDRLATQYRIEVEESEGVWQVVADGSDRTRKEVPGARRKPAVFQGEGLPEADRKKGQKWFAQKQNLEGELRRVEDESKVFAGVFREPDLIRVLNRGNPEQPKEEVTPAVPASFGKYELPATAKEADRRIALADWITRPDHPLTARVMVNRIWQWHFGTGIVDTPSDFGVMGTQPSHPELLDWLAQEFVRGGWSMKQLHRRIVLSATYRQSAEYRADAAAKDADARLLWRFPPRRLMAENIRDTMLAVSGQINFEMFGRGFNLFHQRGGLAGFTPVEAFGPDGYKRMIYAHKVRREPDAVFGAFDCPDAGLSTSRRRESMTPVQALNLMNSRFALDVASAFGQRVQREGGKQVPGQIQRAYLLALGRAATEQEVGECRPVVESHGLGALCRALLNSNEFLFLP
ncbi:MAG: hypothetical protein RLZZ142_2642 [Verrucomicrobiota bacterium]